MWHVTFATDSPITSIQRHRAELNILWLGTRLTSIIGSGAGEREGDVPRLFYYLRSVIQNVQPCGLARAALFFIVASVTLRTSDISLWVELKEAVLNKKYDLPYQDWTLLERISFAFLMSCGPPGDHIGLQMNLSQQRQMERLVISFRGYTFGNIFRLLGHSATMEFIKKESDKSLLHHIQKSAYEELIIMRTGTMGEGHLKHHLKHEYIWIKVRSQVCLYRMALSSA